MPKDRSVNQGGVQTACYDCFGPLAMTFPKLHHDSLPTCCFDYNSCHCCCYKCIQNANILDDIIKQLNDKQCTQPVLFKFSDRFWIKTDNSAIAVSCVADAFDFMFRFYWVVNVEYPHELRLVIGFFEKLLHLKPTGGKSVAIEEFSRAVLASP